jgi:dual 3',5'-cyclic-AMP and -GMP phosphodiesterase 11
LNESFQRFPFVFVFFHLQAFATLSEKLTPLVDGVRDNKNHWLEIAQNVQEQPPLRARKKSIHTLTFTQQTNNSSTTLTSSPIATTPNINLTFNNNNSNTNNNYNNNSKNKFNNNCSLPVSDNEENSTSSNDSGAHLSKIVGRFPLISSSNTTTQQLVTRYLKKNGSWNEPTKDNYQLMDQ